MEDNSSYATVLDFNNSEFIYKMSNNCEAFNFHIACYSFTLPEVVRIAMSTLWLKDVLPLANNNYIKLSIKALPNRSI